MRDYVTAIKTGQWHPFTSTERKVRAATRNKPWGPTGKQLNDIANLSFYQREIPIIVAVLQLRLQYRTRADKAHCWRNIYKSLSVIEFLLRSGSDEVVAQLQRHIAPEVDGIANGAYCMMGPDGRDMASNVQHRARAILLLLTDEERLKLERAEEAARKGRIQGAGWHENPTQPLGPAPTAEDVTEEIEEQGQHDAEDYNNDVSECSIQHLGDPTSAPVEQPPMVDLMDFAVEVTGDVPAISSQSDSVDKNDPFVALEDLFLNMADKEKKEELSTVPENGQVVVYEQQPCAAAVYHPPWAPGSVPRLHVYDALKGLGSSSEVAVVPISASSPMKENATLSTIATPEKAVDEKDERWRKLVSSGLDDLLCQAAYASGSHKTVKLKESKPSLSLNQLKPGNPFL